MVRKSYRMIPKKPFPVLCCFCSTSLLLISLGIITLTTWRHLYNYIMASTAILYPGSTAYEIWKKNPIPMAIDFYFHNWTNYNEFESDNVTLAKPKFQQLGPYRFIEEKYKVNLVWNKNGTVTYDQRRLWFFQPDQSNGTLDDPVVSLNPVSLTAAYSTRHWNFFLKKGISITLSSLVPSIYGVHKVGDLLFNGYEDHLFKIGQSVPFASKMSMPGFDKFGWFYTRNDSDRYEGTYNMDTGANGQIGQLYNWRYSNQTPYYEGQCGRVEGSAGEFFDRNLTPNSTIKFFSSDLCRKVELEYDHNVTINGIVGYRYSAHDKFLDNGTRLPENKCFCIGDCMPYGALNVSACRFGSPAFVSLPNFYKADPYYTRSIDGMNPSGDKHDFYMIFEPTTGIPLQVAARLQLNLLLLPNYEINMYRNVPKIYFPVLWFEQVVTIPNHMSFMIKLLINMEVICNSIGIACVFLGLIISVFFIYRVCSMNICSKSANMSDPKDNEGTHSKFKRKSDLMIKEMEPLKVS